MLVIDYFLPTSENRIRPKKCNAVILRYSGKRTKKALQKRRALKYCDLAGARTQDPLIKSQMLYQLSYQINLFCLLLKDLRTFFKAIF